MKSYRESHLSHNGCHYHDEFKKGYRNALWNFEKEVLLSAVSKCQSLESKYLDFACGTGRVLSLLELHFKESYGVDVSPRMLAECEKNIVRAHMLKLDLTNEYYFDPSTFDFITAFRFFPGAEYSLQEDVILKLSSLLKPGGVLIFNNHRSYSGLFFVMQRALYWLKGRNWNVTCLRDERVHWLIEHANLQLEEVHYWGLLPVNEGKDIVPSTLLTMVEKIVSFIPFIKKYSTAKIYICRRGYAE